MMIMRSTATRIIILVTTILIATIIGIQTYWLKKTYSFEKKEFSNAVIKSIRGLYEDINLSNMRGLQLNNLIEHPSDNVFIFNVNDTPERDSLMKSLISEFDDFKVYASCKVAVYDNISQKYLYQCFIKNAATFNYDSTAIDLPLIKAKNAYVYLDFPNRADYILSNLSNWVFTSILIFVLLVSLGISVYYLYRQKFLYEIQNDFINNVTHEFSTPLTVIDLSAEALMKPNISSNPAKYQKYVASIRYQNDYLKKHIQNLIATVVTKSYKLKIDKTRVYPNELVKRAIMQLEPIATQKNGTINFQPMDEGESILADNDNLYLVIFNIINNAVKYSDTPVINITTKIYQGKYTISVKDNGIGIAENEQQKIFNKFYRAQNGNIHNAKGLGLGLYFVKKIIKLHNGQIEVNSVKGIGTEFKIILPFN